LVVFAVAFFCRQMDMAAVNALFPMGSYLL
jgi:hypothetical protein